MYFAEKMAVCKMQIKGSDLYTVEDYFTGLVIMKGENVFCWFKYCPISSDKEILLAFSVQ